MKKKIVRLDLRTRRIHDIQRIINSFSWIYELNTIKSEELIKRLKENVDEYQRVMQDALSSIKITIKEIFDEMDKDDKNE